MCFLSLRRPGSGCLPAGGESDLERGAITRDRGREPPGSTIIIEGTRQPPDARPGKPERRAGHEPSARWKRGTFGCGQDARSCSSPGPRCRAYLSSLYSACRVRIPACARAWIGPRILRPTRIGCIIIRSLSALIAPPTPHGRPAVAIIAVHDSECRPLTDTGSQRIQAKTKHRNRKQPADMRQAASYWQGQKDSILV